MYGFPLKFKRIQKQMHQGKHKFLTQEEADDFCASQPDLKTVYLCPFCCTYHVSSHESAPRYEQERWWIIWNKEMTHATT